MKHLFLTSLFFFASSLAQERFLLHIGRDGRQEAIPLQKNENPADVISRLEQGGKAEYVTVLDTLRYFTSDQQLDVNFSWGRQEVLLQYYLPRGPGYVKEFWWRTDKRSDIGKGIVRGWMVNPRLLTASTSLRTTWMGYYKDPGDGYGEKKPFKYPGDTTFVPGDTTTLARKSWNFDPAGTEAVWRPGGLEVSLDSAEWQGIKLGEWGDTLRFREFEPFGFSLTNNSPPGGSDTRRSVYSKPSEVAPYHSMKYYETGRYTTTDGGWWLRGDYEWGMYVVVEFTQIPPPRIYFDSLGTTLDTSSRIIRFKLCSPGSFQNPVIVKYRVGFVKNEYDSILAIQDSVVDRCTYFHSVIPGALPDTIVSCYIVVTSTDGIRSTSPIHTYKVFKKRRDILSLYNYSECVAARPWPIATDLESDGWCTPIDGLEALDTLLSLFDAVVVEDGSFPFRSIYPQIRNWLAKGTADAPRVLFFTSQDYGCYIQAQCGDTSFIPGTFEYDYLGVSKIGPQDLAPSRRPFKIVALPDSVTNYIIKYNQDSTTSLWHFPTFEMGYSGYPDAINPTATAKALFVDDSGNYILGVRNESSSFKTMFVAFDARALQFRSDTSKSPGEDPKYRWIVDVGSLAKSFMRNAGAVLGVAEDASPLPEAFLLQQNYPNPFNARTAVSYQLSAFSSVMLKVYDVLGREVAVLVNERKAAGRHTVEWDASRFASGIYFYRLQAGSFVKTMKMILLK